MDSKQVGRRAFMKLAVAAAATPGLAASIQEPPPTPVPTPSPAEPRAPEPRPSEPPPIPLGNAEPPAIQFQAWPGGSGTYLHGLVPAEPGRGRSVFKIEPWKGPVPGSEEEIAFLPVHRLAALVRARRISPVELTRIYLDRLKRLDPTLLCAVNIMEGPAREAAQQAEAEIKAGRYRGPLHGIPWGVKDLFSTRGVPTTWGDKEFEKRVIDEDAEVVVRMREAGAVLIAKLATGRFAEGDNWFRGRTKNPWNPAQGSSGSSAGPASATAAGAVAFGIGTETQGSIVSPAIRCGLSALRPTFGRISRYGGMVLAWSMDKVGPLCRTVEDCALVFEALHGADEKDPATLTAPFRWDPNPDLARMRIGHDERAPKDFLDKLRELGANPRPMPERPNARGVSPLGVESAAAFDFYVGSRKAEDKPAETEGASRAADRFTRGRTVTALDFLQSQRRRQIVIRKMAEVMKDFDLYVSGTGDVVLTNQTGHPAVVVPYRMTEGEHPQPACTTLIGALFADDRILGVANAVQRAFRWPEVVGEAIRRQPFYRGTYAAS